MTNGKGVRREAVREVGCVMEVLKSAAAVPPHQFPASMQR